MSLLQRLKERIASFMLGRHGPDNLGMFTLIAGLVCSILGSLTGIGLLSLIGFALYVWTLFRMFSKNNEKRWEENRKYIELSSNWKTKYRQFINRTKNRKEYKYFKCPNCKLLLRVKRGSGEREITCARCEHKFTHKC